MPSQRREVGYLDGIMIFLLAIAGNIAAQLIAGVVMGVAGVDSGENTYVQLVFMVLFQLVFLSVPVIYYSVKKIRPVLMYPVKKPHPSLLLSIALPVIAMLGFMLPALLFETLLLNNGYTPSGLEFNGAGETAFAIIVTVLLAPCVEELIFRGFLLSGLRREFNPYIAALLCATAFSLMHMNPEQTVYQFCLGYVCALAAIKSGTLLAPIIVHAGSNLLAVVADVPIMKFVELVTYNAVSTVLGTIGLFVAGAAAVLGICKAMEALNKRAEAKREVSQTDESGDAKAPSEKNAKNRKTGLLLYIGSLGICLVMWIFVFAAAML